MVSSQRILTNFAGPVERFSTSNAYLSRFQTFQKTPTDGKVLPRPHKMPDAFLSENFFLALSLLSSYHRE